MFKCKGCNEELSNAKMIGLVIGQIGREKAISQGLSNSSKTDFIAGLVSGFKVKCPKCNATNWDYS